MANIKEYNAGQLGLQIPETGIEATAQAARRVGTFYNQAGEAIANVGQRLGSSIRDAGDAAVAYISHREKSAGAATLSLGIDGKDKEWNDILKDPKTDANDPSIANNFRTNSLEPFLQDWSKGFVTEEGQRWAESRIESVREHFWKKTSADQARMSGAEAVNNLTSVAYRAANSAYNDDSSIDLHMGLLDAALKNTSPTMSAEQHEKLLGPFRRSAMEKIVEEGFRGRVDRDPNHGEDIAAEYSRKYGDLFKPGDSALHVKYVQAAQRRADAEDRAAEADARRKKAEDAQTAYFEWYNKLYNEDGSVNTTVNKGFLAQIGRDPRMTPQTVGSLRAAFNELKTRGNAEHDAPGLLNELVNRVLLKPDDPRFVPMDEVVKNHAGRDLTKGSIDFLYRMAKNVNAPDTRAEAEEIKRFGKYLGNVIFPNSDPFLGIKDPAQAAARFNFENWFWPEYQTQRGKNVDFRKLFSFTDPESLMNNFDKFKPSPTSVLDTINSRSTPAPVPKKPAAPAAASPDITMPTSPDALPKGALPRPSTLPPVPFAPTEGGPVIDFDTRFRDAERGGAVRPALDKLMQDYISKGK